VCEDKVVLEKTIIETTKVKKMIREGAPWKSRRGRKR